MLSVFQYLAAFFIVSLNAALMVFQDGGNETWI